jgi:hypothetical protein
LTPNPKARGSKSQPPSAAAKALASKTAAQQAAAKALASKTAAQQAAAKALVGNAAAEHAAATVEEAEAGLAEEASPPPPDRVTEAELRSAYQQAVSAKQTRVRLAAQLNERLETLDGQRQVLAKEAARVDDLRKDTLDKAKSDDVVRRMLAERETTVLRLEADAEAGFLRQQDEILAPVRSAIAELRAAWETEQSTQADAWQAGLRSAGAQLEERRLELADEFRQRQAGLAAGEAELESRRFEFERLEQKLQFDREAFDEDARDLKARTDIAMESAVGDLRQELDDARSRNSQLVQRLSSFATEQDANRSLEAALGDDPRAVLERLDDLRQKNLDLQRELEARPPVWAVDEVAQLQNETDDLRRDCHTLSVTNRDLAAEATRLRSEVMHQTTIEERNGALEASLESYRRVVGELKDQIESYTDLAAEASSFPECLRMDEDSQHWRPISLRTVPDLEAFVEDLQVRMAFDPDALKRDKRLSYEIKDLRLFVAGLAMSHLHLLEGVSGTGKTTLPLAFANAVQGGYQKVEVQAGWRDKQDLLGFYNSFEKVFRESPFTLGLYKALQPEYSDRIFVIVLDEMNLSHPEQYFADILSALEDPKADVLIPLIDRLVPSVPTLLSAKEGVKLPLPKNVWFVGTANQDETTFAFAPKTYDRAHVMELRRHDRGDIFEAPEAAEPVSVSALFATFKRAMLTHADAGIRANQCIAKLQPFFNKEFKTGWGNRLEQHVSSFVPVHIATGGSLGESLDHLMATKVLRKIHGRHTRSSGKLRELRGLVEASWPDVAHPASACLDVIEAEITDLDGN